MTDKPTSGSDLVRGANAVLRWLLDHSYLNGDSIEFGAGFTQSRPGILAGALIDAANGWHGQCQFCHDGQETYADGNPTGDACSRCKGKGNVQELSASDIYDYYEALSDTYLRELDAAHPVAAEAVDGYEDCPHCVDGIVPMTLDRPCVHCHPIFHQRHPLPTIAAQASVSEEDVDAAQLVVANYYGHSIHSVGKNAMRAALESFAKRIAAQKGGDHG